MADINVIFEADESGLAQAIAAAKGQLASLDQSLIATGQKMAAAFQKSGILPANVFKGLDPANQQALAAYYASLEKVESGTNKVTEATEKMGGATQRAGINFGAMMERMMVRMAVFELIRLGIQGVKAALDEMANIGQAEGQFARLSGTVEGAGEAIGKSAVALKLLKESSLEVGGGFPAAEKMAETLMNYGAAADEAAVQVEGVGRATRSLAGDEKEREKVQLRLIEAQGRLRLGEENESDLRLMAQWSGNLREENLKLVNSYAELKRAGPAAIKAIDDNLRQLEETERKTEQATERAERAQEKAEDRRLSGLEKLEQFLERGPAQMNKMTAAFERGAGPETQREGMERLMRGGTPAAPGIGQLISPSLRQRYEQGIEALATEFHYSAKQVRDLVGKGAFDYAYVLRAGKEKQQDADEATRQASQDRLQAAREQAQGQKESVATQIQTSREAAESAVRRGYAPPIQTAGAAPAAVTTVLPGIQQQATDMFLGGVVNFQKAVDALINKVIPTKDQHGETIGALKAINETLRTVFAGG
jgi:hypothetical protein